MIKRNTGPYIGVTGFMALHEVVAALRCMPHASNRRLMVGVLMSGKTLAGHANRHSGRYPRREAVAGIFISDPRVLNLVHYHPEDPSNIVEDVRRIVDLAGPRLDGIQLNVTWPDPSRIEAIRHMFPRLYLVLQVGPGAMAKIPLIRKGWRMEFFRALARYTASIDAVLIDGSGGTGTPLDVRKTMPWLRVAYDIPGIEVGVAGGLDAATVPRIGPLAATFPELNIDAEGRLRIPPGDTLSLARVKEYLTESHRILQ